ncbi:MAG: 4Fe-4S dicluster domain-containing protein, partial [Raoultibacter sp.]
DPIVEAKACMDIAEKHQVPVIIMEPARGGRLADLPDRAATVLREADPSASQVSWAYRFCWNLPHVLTVLAGMSTLEQVHENAASFKANKPFAEAELAALDEAITALRSVPTIPCTNCGYCVKDCPEGVKIPEILNLLNLERLVEDHGFVQGLYSWQAAAGLASLCTACGVCESMCPQSIDISDQLEIAARKYE